jgi:hypothetical protein
VLRAKFSLLDTKRFGLSSYRYVCDRPRRLQAALTRITDRAFTDETQSMAPSSGASAQATSYLVNHIVLPPQLPQRSDYDAAHERHLVVTTLQALQEFKNRIDLRHTSAITSAIATVKNLRDSRDTDGNISEVQLVSILEKVACSAPGSIVPLEFKAQNAGIIITSHSDSVSFEAFELSPTNEAAMSSKGRLVRTFPALASEISVDDAKKPELIQSLARTISKLSSQTARGMQPQVQKNGKKLSEERDTTNPAMVTDYLMSLIAAHGTTTKACGITKNTREEVLWNACLDPWQRSPLWLLIRVSLQLLFTLAGSDLPAPDSLYKAFTIQLLSCILDDAKWYSLGSDTLYAISAKLRRRLRKMEHAGQLQCFPSSWVSHIRSSVSDCHTVMGEH